MRQTEGVAILATQLAGGDRRALSQAWYSALHLAEADAPRARAATMRTIAAVHAPLAVSAPVRGAQARATATYPAAVQRAAVSGDPRPAASAERRAPRTRFDRSLERAVSRRVDRGACGSFSLAASGGRVQVLVRVERGTTRVVALCAPSLRERVERALAHVRFAVTTHHLAQGARP